MAPTKKVTKKSTKKTQKPETFKLTVGKGVLVLQTNHGAMSIVLPKEDAITLVGRALDLAGNNFDVLASKPEHQKLANDLLASFFPKRKRK